MKRRIDLDWLRVLTIFGVLLVHCAKFFDPNGWLISNDQHLFGLSLAVAASLMWIMPTFFLISEMCTRFALARTSGSRFLLERTKRLLVPFVFGVLVIVPPQIYFERLAQGHRFNSYFDFYAHYFDGVYWSGGNFDTSGHHLWFLLALFLVTVASLPLLLLFNRPHGSRLVQDLLRTLPEKLAVIYLFATVVAIEGVLSGTRIGSSHISGWSPVHYGIFFLIGFILASQPDLERACSSLCFPAAFGTALLTAGLIWSWLSPTVRDCLPPRGWHMLWALGGSTGLIAIMGCARRFFRRPTSSLLHSLREIGMPFYILHQTVLVYVAARIRSWPAVPVVKYGVLALCTAAASWIIAEFVVLRVPAFRFLFGLRAGAPHLVDDLPPRVRTASH